MLIGYNNSTAGAVQMDANLFSEENKVKVMEYNISIGTTQYQILTSISVTITHF